MNDRDEKYKPYPLTDEIVMELEGSLSPERLATYLRETDGDKKAAIRLHVWNTDISAAFYGPLQALEITLRNAMHIQLGEHYGANWYDNPAIEFNEKHRQRLEEAKSGLQPKAFAPADMVAILSFGFWVFLLISGYNENLWRPTLRKAFPKAKNLTRKQVHTPLIKLHALRNRIAHHEPIFAYPLDRRYSDILEVIGWISPHTKAWVAAHSRIQETLGLARGCSSVRF